MPPTPITLHLPVDGSGKAFISIDRTALSPLSPKHSPSTRSLTPSQRRKSKHLPTIATSSAARLTPLNRPIIQRCFPPPPSPTSSSKTKPPSSTPSTSSTSTAPTAGWLLYPHISDLANTRSSHPSPREVARAHRAEEDKARQKRESLAPVGVAAALSRTKKRTGTSSRSRGSSGGEAGSRVESGTHVRAAHSTSPKLDHEVGTGAKVEKTSKATGIQSLVTDNATLPINTNATGTAKGPNVPTIQTKSASPTPSPISTPLISFRSSAGLKRTRSAGLLSISPSAANGLSRPVSIGSPLKAVIGPMSDSEDEGEVSQKRARLSGPPALPDGVDSDSTIKREVKTLPITDGIGEIRRLRGRVASNSGTMLGLGIGVSIPTSEIGAHSSASGGAASKSGSTAMRRAVSASGIDGPNSIFHSPIASSLEASVGSSGMLGRASAAATRTKSVGPEIVRERSRREVVMPARMRDYDMKTLA